MSSSVEPLKRRVRQIAVKLGTGKPITAEDVHIAAVLWAATEHPDEAAAGTTTAADLTLVACVRANDGAGDATAQTVCDAAVRWRDQQPMVLPDSAGVARRLLADATTGYQAGPMPKPRPVYWFTIGASCTLFLILGLSPLLVVGVPRAWAVGLAAAGAVGFMVSVGLLMRLPFGARGTRRR